MTTLAILLIVCAVVYLFLGGREGFTDRVAELARLGFAVSLLALLIK